MIDDELTCLCEACSIAREANEQDERRVEQLEQMRRYAVYAAAERDAARAHRDRLVDVLTAIHAQLAGSTFTHNGVTYTFNPKDKEMYWPLYTALCERIRAIPDELAEAAPLSTAYIPAGTTSPRVCTAQEIAALPEAERVRYERGGGIGVDEISTQPPMFGDLEAKLREKVDFGEYDFGTDPLHISAADAIRDLRVALASQIEITNTERTAKERLESHQRWGAPEGWKLVPVNPTRRMTCEAFICATNVAPDGWSLGSNDSQEFFGHIYRAMLGIAPDCVDRT